MLSYSNIYRSVELKNRKRLNMSNEVVVVTTNEQANSLAPFTIYQWEGRLNVNVRQFHATQFGDLIFSTLVEAVEDKQFTVKRLNRAIKNVKDELKECTELLRAIRKYKNKLATDSMANDYITGGMLEHVVKRYSVKLTPNQWKSLHKVECIYFKDNAFDALGTMPGCKLQCSTVDKLLDVIVSQLRGDK